MEPTLVLRDSLSLNIKILRFFGEWPPEEIKSTWKTSLYLVWSCIILNIAYLSYYPGEFLNIIYNWTDLEEVIGTCLFLFTRIACGFKIVVFVFNRKKLISLMSILQSKEFMPENLEQKRILKSMMTEIKFISTIFVTMGVITVILRAIFPEIDSVTRGQMTLPLNHWEPLNTKKTPYFQITYFYHIFIYLSTATNNIAMDTFISGMMAHGVVQLEILKNSLETILDRTLNEITFEKGKPNTNCSVNKVFNTFSFTENKNFQQKLNNKFKKCITHHKQILRFTTEVESLFNLGIFVQIAASVIVICMTTFQISLMSPSSLKFQSTSLYLSCILVEIFLFCWYGEGLIISSASLPNSIYISKWYECGLETSYKKNMIIFMMRALKPITFKPGSFFILSIQMFTSILRSSYTYYAVLQQVHNTE